MWTTQIWRQKMETTTTINWRSWGMALVISLLMWSALIYIGSIALARPWPEPKPTCPWDQCR